jgi:Uncharacterized protein conserved in bacteria
MSGLVRWIGLSALAAAATINVATAETPAEFYAGKTFTIVVGSDVGGGYDTNARLCRAISENSFRAIPP